ncbi:MAG: polysaccharide deacetylase family protein [Clostridiales bacterium]|nr:polysaccharide deacetylase family protein [Clostridiales bacterium]
MKMQKITKILLCALLVCAMSLMSFAHAETTAYNWYVKNNDTHTAPVLDKELCFIDKYDTYYVDADACDDDKVIYLTFDAGYENGNVEKILDVLKDHNAAGAFFVLDNIIMRNPELVKRMSDEGHLVCNHTAKHHDMTKITNKEQFAQELKALEDAYFELTGRDMAKFYRPPEGRFSEQNLSFAKDLGYKTVFWSFAYADWDNNKQPDEEKSIEKVLSHTHNGEIILLHPTSATNAAIMDRLLTEWENQGYRFGSLSEL